MTPSTEMSSHDIAVSSVAGRSGLLTPCADYISLTKPGVMALLLVSTACPMILAARGEIPVWEILAALIGGALVSGSASAMNCIWDRDIDAVMTRTRNRPLAAGRISPLSALLFAVLMGSLGLFVLARYLNPSAAFIALIGHLFYVLVYTIWLKRRTVQNIVIGGAAGAIPPVVGWVGITGTIDLTAVLLFLVVFLWTPPHFWALALNKHAEYSRAGVPMLPTVSGAVVTQRQMLSYSVLLIPVTLLLVVVDDSLGVCSLAALFLLGGVFVFKCYELLCLGIARDPRQSKKAWEVFGFSLVYLALFFAVLVFDSLVV